MPLFGTRDGKRNSSRAPAYARKLEQFRTEILYETLEEKGYAVSLVSASIHSRGVSLENAARDLRRILPPPRDPSRRKSKSRWLWALAIIGVILISALGGLFLYLVEPKTFNTLLLIIEEYLNFFYDQFIVPIINFVSTV